MEPTNQPFRNENDLNQTSMGDMFQPFIFQGVGSSLANWEKTGTQITKVNIHGWSTYPPCKVPPWEIKPQ